MKQDWNNRVRKVSRFASIWGRRAIAGLQAFLRLDPSFVQALQHAQRFSLAGAHLHECKYFGSH